MSINFCVLPDVEADENTITISNVQAYIAGSKDVEKAGGGFADCHSQVECPIANPISIYEKYKSRRNS